MDLNQVKSLFTATDYERGMEYYRQGRVTDMQCTKAGPETNVSCTVRGSKRYTVRFTEMAEGRLRISCTCPRYADVGRCKHLAAAMIAYIGEPPHESVPGSDSCARWMLQRYLQITQESIEPSQQPARLTAVMRTEYGCYYPSFSLRVGYDRLYSVQNIREFLDNVSQRRTVVYGKGLTLEHNLELFEPKAQAMIRLLMNEYGRYRALGSSSYYMGYEPPDYRKNEITLTGDSFDRWFDLLSDAPVDCAGSEPLTLTQADPQVRLQIAEEGGGAWLTVQTPCPYRFFGSYRSLYALGGGKLLRCFQRCDAEQLRCECNHITVRLTPEAMVMILIQLHARVPVIMKGTADHPVSADTQPEMFRRHSRRDRCFHGFKNCHRHFSFQYFRQISLSTEYTEKKP